MIEIGLAIFLGLLIGTITGIVPGIHINLISVFLVSSLTINLDPLITSCFIVSLAITHTFIDFIPSIFLGAPEEGTFLSILPGHELLAEGKGHEAVTLSLYGSAIGALCSILLIPPFIYLSSIIAEKGQVIPFILILIFSFIILRERKIILAFSVFILAGFLGYASLNLPIKEPLLPLLSGLFGASSLILSIKEKAKIKDQEITSVKVEKKDFTKTIFSSFFVAPIFSFLPALGSGYASIVSSEIFGYSKRGFIMINGAVNIIVMFLSFILIYSIGKARTGAAAAINSLLIDISFQDLTTIIFSGIFASFIAFLIGIKISKIFARNIWKIKYTNLSKITLIFLTIIVLIISSPIGFLVYLTSAALGVFAISSKIKRIHLMGSLLVPTLLYYI